MFTKEAQELAKPTTEAVKKISKGKWHWKPEVGEQFLKSGNELDLIINKNQKVWPKDIPLLHWERIEQIVEGMGYEVKEQKERSITQSAQCWICPTRNHPQATGKDLHDYLKWREVNTIIAFGKTRQEAVMRAVVELAKESSLGIKERQPK